MATRLKDLSLIELSLVDVPANKQSKVSIFKAATKREDGKDFPASDYAYVPDREAPSTWKLRLTSTPGGEPDPAIVAAAAAALGPGFRGNRVEIPADARAAVVARVRAAWRKAYPDMSEEDMPTALKKSSDRDDSADNEEPDRLDKRKEKSEMADDNKKEIDELKTQLADLKKELKASKDENAVLTVKASMTDAERAHMQGMSDAERQRFMGMSAEDRARAMKKFKEDDEVITVEGQEVRKSAVGAVQFAIIKAQAKRISDNEAAIQAANKAARTAEFKKRASDEFPHLPGSVDERAAVLEALAAAPEPVRKTADEILRAAEGHAKAAFARAGHKKTDGSDGESATEQLDKLAKEHAKANNVTYEKAYSVVIQKNATLYARSLEEGRQAN